MKIVDNHKILLVEGDAETGKVLKRHLMLEKYEIICTEDGQEACRLFDCIHINLVVLDLMMLGMNSMNVMQHIRKNSAVPIIILSARSSEEDKILWLSLGADDYITKPFSVAEVIARINANIRRSTQYFNVAPAAPVILTTGDLTMNLTDYTIQKNGQEVNLTAKEFEILKLFLQNPLKVFSKEEIYTLVWKDRYLGDGNAINVHISKLRNKIEDSSLKPKYILTVRGIGYKLGELN